jgi:LacI family transcriptional regulator
MRLVSATDASASNTAMKIALLLRLNYSMQRNRLIGVFNAIASNNDLEIQILQSEDELREALLQPDDQRPDGIITYTPREDTTRHLIANSRIPIAVMGIDRALQRSRKSKIAFIENDNESIGRHATSYLMGLGNFRSFVYVPYRQKRPWSVIRGSSFIAALSAAKRDCLVYKHAPDTYKDFSQLTRFIASLDKPAAIFTANDERAQDVLRAARHAKVKVPQEVSVLGVDDDELICERSMPPLSSVRMDAIRQGFEAAKGLKALLNSRSKKAISIKVPIIGITERASTRPISQAAHLIDKAMLFIKSEYHKDISPADVAMHLGISRTLLFLRFRQFTKTSIAEAIRSVRLEESKRLLKSSKRKINSIFKSVGFKSPVHATRLFKKKTGMTPIEWRNH